MIRIAIIAPALALRIGLREVLGRLPGVEVVAQAARVDDVPLNDADILILTSAGEISALLDTSETPAPILLLADDPGEAQFLQQMNLSVWGLLPLNASEAELEAALHALNEGLWVGSPALLRGLFQRSASIEATDTSPLADPLTGREIEVLQMMAQGLANKQIAVSLGISEHTVKFHLSSLYAKMGVTSRTEAVRAGARRGLVVL